MSCGMAGGKLRHVVALGQRRVRPMVTRVERYAGRCQCCNRTTSGPLPDGLEPGTPFSVNIVALAMYLRFVHAVSYRRLSRLMLELYGLCISEGALDP
jgi:transposase